jgi:hypothetical protein
MKTLYARPLLAAILAVTLVGGPISPAFGQEAQQTPQAAPAKTATPIVPVALGSAKHNYTRGPKFFPNLLAPYSPISIEAPGLTNSPRIDQLIHDGRLELSMQEAVELALENSMDIVVQRYFWEFEREQSAAQLRSADHHDPQHRRPQRSRQQSPDFRHRYWPFLARQADVAYIDLQHTVCSGFPDRYDLLHHI